MKPILLGAAILTFLKFQYVVLLLVTIVFGLLGCVPIELPEKIGNVEPWFNPKVFNQSLSTNSSPFDLTFEVPFSSNHGESVLVNSCLDIAALGESQIAEYDYQRWSLLSINCMAAMRFLSLPQYSTSYLPETFEKVVGKLPATAVPYLGGDKPVSDSRTLQEVGQVESVGSPLDDSVNVVVDDMAIRYVLVAQGDFNTDGLEDWLIRMDWVIPDSLGAGHDWLAVTKYSLGGKVRVLWRK